MKKAVQIFLFLSTSLIAQGQDFLGYANSNYAGVSGVNLNPASIADSRFKFDILIVGTSLNFSNNYVGMKKTALAHPNKSLLAALKDSTGNSFPAFQDDDFQNKYLFRKDNDSKKSIMLSNRIQFPSLMVTINNKSAIALTGEMRSYINVDGIQSDLAQLLWTGFEDTTLWNKNITNDHLSVQYMSWLEFGADYARVIVDKKKNFLKAGIRPKLLLGLGSAYLFADNLEYLTNNNDTLTFFQSNIQYGHSTNFDFPENKGIAYNLRGTVSHPGIGLDIGLIYEWRPNYQDYKYEMDGETDLWRKSKNKYKLRAGLSIVDIGSITYDRGPLSKSFIADVNQWNVSALKFDSLPIQAWDDTLTNRFTSIPEGNSYKMNLPTTISTQIDYNIWKDFYVNFTGSYAVQWTKNANKVHDLTSVSITPRWDYKWFGVMMPFAYNQYRNFTTGTCVRIGPIILGTNALAPYLSKNKTIYGADFYFQLKLPAFFKEPKDKDMDKVSDKKDRCLETPGIWEFYGCPDRDGDHVEDSKDLCPDVPGLKQYNGCPDRDGDGIIDTQDACPDIPGIAKLNGCPDKDGDGITDKDDDCPDVPGLLKFKGCPDKDEDGVMDKIDLCPEKPGPPSNEGCPETKLFRIDNAGATVQISIQAKDGSFTYESLPNDSICIFRLEGEEEKTIGVNDARVIVNGSSKRAIRSQADGFFRFDIPKPIATGLKSLVVDDVVVLLTKEEQVVVKKAFDNLEFETSKNIINPTSDIALNELAGLLMKHPKWKIKISGHTDNVGKPAVNMTLSKKRSEAVKKYLMDKGVTAERIVIDFYGQTRPIAPNTTEEGRSKNRRVEMLIIE